MTKQDRAKMRDRFIKRLADEAIAEPSIGKFLTIDDVVDFAAGEVTRAVRAERKAQRDTEKLWASHRRRADEQMVERAQGLGRKRT